MAAEIENNFANSDTQTRLLAQKRRELEAEKSGLERDKAIAGVERKLALDAAHDKTEHDLVEISREADNQIAATKKLQTDRLRSLNENSQKHYEEIADRTADQIKRISDGSLKLINQRSNESMERIRFVTERANDPFYHVQSLNPELSENEKEFLIKVKLPEHEAKNLLITGDGPYVKITLSRRFQETAKSETPGRSTQTNSFQSVVEAVPMPSAYDARGIARDYADGTVTVRIPKMKFGIPETQT
jgi:HSP20 family molecular chaperone IbpA